MGRANGAETEKKYWELRYTSTSLSVLEWLSGCCSLVRAPHLNDLVKRDYTVGEGAGAVLSKSPFLVFSLSVSAWCSGEESAHQSIQELI